MDVQEFVHLSMEGNLSCLQFLVIMNKAAVNIHLQVLCGCMFSYQLGKYTGAQLL